MNTILVPLDGSELAAQVLPAVRTLAATLSAKIHLIHIVSDEEKQTFLDQYVPLLWSTPNVPVDTLTKDEQICAVLQRHADTYLQATAQALHAEGFDVTTEICFGSPAAHIVEAAGAHHAILIAMATHGYSGLRRWSVGSVTDKVVHATTAPVFVLRGQDAALAPDAFTIRRILVPLDGSNFARQAITVATRLAACAQARLHLLRAVLPADNIYPILARSYLPEGQLQEFLNEMRQEAAADLEDVADELRQSGLLVTTQVAIGHPAEVIVEEARHHQSDAIVMATHGYSGIQRWALGSVADKVLHATTTPLLLVRAKEH